MALICRENVLFFALNTCHCFFACWNPFSLLSLEKIKNKIPVAEASHHANTREGNPVSMEDYSCHARLDSLFSLL